MKSYAGIGSRETPHNVCLLFEKVATYLANQEYILRSGHADGADQAFERGCIKAGGKKEIYLPWKGFEGSHSSLVLDDERAFAVAEKFHPYWHNLTQGAQKLQARNSYQVLGLTLDDPVQFVLCWTKKGKGQGGTGQALRIAKHYNIPIFDTGKYEDVGAARIEMKKFLVSIGVES